MKKFIVVIDSENNVYLFKSYENPIKKIGEYNKYGFFTPAYINNFGECEIGSLSVKARGGFINTHYVLKDIQVNALGVIENPKDIVCVCGQMSCDGCKNSGSVNCRENDKKLVKVLVLTLYDGEEGK